MDRKNALRSIIGLTAAALVPAVAGMSGADAAAQKTRRKAQNVVFHLNDSQGENSLYSAFMGIGLATSLRRMGAGVTLMLDASGPNFAKRSWSDKSLAAPPSMPSMTPMSLGDLLAKFVQAGGSIRLCPHCSAMCGVTPGTTVPGARIAADGELARIIYDADKVINY